MTQAHSAPGARDGWLFATLAAITTVSAIVSSLGAPLVPSIADEYDVPLSTAQWILTATLVTAAATTSLLGRWGSGRLRRPVILGSLLAVLAGTVLAALPLTIGTLIAGRALQGLGLAIAPLALAVAREAWSGPRLASRLSLLGVAAITGAGLGYPVTGFIAQHTGLAGAYWFGVVLVAGTVALAARHLPRPADGVPQRVDLPGALLVGVGAVSLLLAISQGERWGWSSYAVLSPAAAGVALLAAWVVRSLHVARRGGQPLVDLRLSLRPGLRGPNVVAFALATGMYGLLTVVVLLVSADGSRGWGLAAGSGAAGLVLVPYAVLSVLGSRVALRVSRRFGPQWLLPFGSTVFASAMALLAVFHDSLWQALLVMAVGGLGSGFTFSSLPMLIVPHVPAAETGSAMAFNQLLRFLGFSMGSAAGVALIDVYGGDARAFEATCLTLGAVCLTAGVGALLARRPPLRHS